MRILATALCLAAATPGFAGVCGPDRDTDIPLFEAAKTAFLGADYQTVARIVGELIGTPDAVYRDYFAQLRQYYPDGFSGCTTVLQRREEPGFLQELVFFHPEDKSGHLAFLIVAVEMEGRVQVVEFNYNTSVGEVLLELK